MRCNNELELTSETHLCFDFLVIDGGSSNCLMCFFCIGALACLCSLVGVSSHL